MDVISPTLLKLGVIAAKLLAKRCFSGILTLSEIGEDLTGSGIETIGDAFDRKKIERSFQGYGEKIARTLRTKFEKDTNRHGMIRIKAIIDLLNQTLESRVTSELLLAKNLDASRIADALRPKNELLIDLRAEELDIFNDSFDETIRYIVSVADELPEFMPSAINGFLLKLDKLESLSDKLLQTIKKIERAEGTYTFSRYEKDYRQAVVIRFDVMELFGADIAVESRKHSLSAAFVSLHIERKASKDDAGISKNNDVTIGELLSTLPGGTRKLLIRGDAGSGKSTLFRWIAIRAAETLQLSDGRPSRWQQYVPFLIRLRDCHSGRLPEPDEIPGLIARELSKPPIGWVKSILDSGRAIIMLDGVDEVPRYQRDSLYDDIKAIVRTYRKNLFIISTRPLAVPDNWLGRIGFEEARINPMSVVDRSNFISRWHEAVDIEVAKFGDVISSSALAEELIDTLANSPSVARLATNPLLCAMICALHRDRGKRLPEDQADLCEALCQMLLHRRESESQLSETVAVESYRKLRYEQKRLIIQRIAYYMVLAGISTISQIVLEIKIGQVLKTFHNSSEDDAQVVSHNLVERCGMLREAKPNYYDFVHNTFKEFLAAEVFANENDEDCLISHRLDADWQQVIQFSVTTRRENIANSIIIKILDAAEATSSPKDSRFLLMLGLRCSAMALQLDKAVKDRLGELVYTLFPPQSKADAESLSNLGDIAVPFLKYRKRMQLTKCISSIHALRLIGTKRSLAALRDYSADLRKPVYTDLASAIHPLHIAAVVNLFRTCQSLPERIASQLADLKPLSGTNFLEHLDLRGTNVAGIEDLASSVSLKTLILRGLRIVDIKVLSALQSLEWLDLRNTLVVDLDPIKNLNSLKMIDLVNVDMRSLGPLQKIHSLEEIHLSLSLSSQIPPGHKLRKIIIFH